MRRKTPLQQRQDAYRRSLAEADRARARFRAGIRSELKRGRTLEDVGDELGLTRQRVQQLAAR
jgi:DNA-directed RNA polymerase sigma subunit (sigma70/sigma32)